MIRKAEKDDMARILKIYDIARSYMAASGNQDQWGNDKYPSLELLTQDLELKRLYVYEDENGIGGVFVYYLAEEEEYDTVVSGTWKYTSLPYGVLHRIAVARSGRGIGSVCMNWCYEQCHNMRGDTHLRNTSMQKLFEKNGFSRCTDLEMEFGHRIGYEKGEKKC